MSIVIIKNKKLNNGFSFQYGDERISFERFDRKTGVNRVQIKVHPNCSVEVAAPIGSDDAEVLSAVKKRGRWIYEKLRGFRKQIAHVTPRKYVSGESHYYLGKQYLLKVIESKDDFQGVKLTRGRLEVFVFKKNTSVVKKLLEDWYKGRAKEVFSKRLSVLLEQTLWVTERPPLTVRTMKTQWGNCSPKGRLTLNPYLVKAPRLCIDYVILHELSHLAEHNHSVRFYRLLQKIMPNWEKTKKRLDGMAALILDT